MEEDIKTLEKFTKIVKGKDYNAKNGWHGYYDKELMDLATALEHLIKGYKQLVEENEELKQRLHRVCKEANKVEWETHSMIPVSLIKKR